MRTCFTKAAGAGRAGGRATASAARWVLPWALLLVAGCFARVDHLHDPARLESARKGEEHFQAFVDDRVGLEGALLGNLEARKDFERLVTEARTRVLDGELAVMSTDISWIRLRARLLQELGALRDYHLSVETVPGVRVRRYFDATDPTFLDGGDEMKKAVDHGNQELALRIDRRQAQVAAVMGVLEVIAKAQKEVRAEAATRKAEAQEELKYWTTAATRPVVGPPPSTQPTTRPNETQAQARRRERMEWISDLLGAIANAGELARDSELIRARATRLQQALLTQIRASQDPASAYALVAIVGTGLDDDSIALLATYVDALKENVEAINARLPRVSAGDDGEPDAGWAELVKALDRAIEGLKRAEFASANDQLRAAQTAPPAAAQALLISPRLIKAQVTLERARQAPQPPPPPPPAPRLSEPPQALAPAMAVSRGMRKEGWHPRRLDQQADRLRDARLELRGTRRAESARVATPAGEPRPAAEFRQSSSAGRAMRAISREDARLPRDVAVREPLDRQLDDPDAATGYRVLRQAFAATPVSALALEKRAAATTQPTADPAKKARDAAFQAGLAALGGIVNDINQQEFETRARIAQFILELYASQEELAGENLRHAEAMLAIAELEGRRWRRIGQLNTDYVAAYLPDNTALPGPPLAANPANPPAPAAADLGAARAAVVPAETRLRHAEQHRDHLIRRLDPSEAAQNRVKMMKLEIAALPEAIASETDRERRKKLVDRLRDLQEALPGVWDRAALAGQLERDARLRKLNEQIASQDPAPWPPEELNRLESRRKKLEADQLAVNPLPDAESKVIKDGQLAHQDLVAAETDLTDAQEAHENAVAELALWLPTNDDHANGSTARLFRQEAELSKEHKEHYKGLTLAIRHPPVLQKNGTVSSIRRLAHAAKAAREGNEVHDEHAEYRVAASNARLFQALRTLQGHVLLLSYNRHTAEENALRLGGELAEHALHLQATEARVEESGFRLTLGDLKAYHATGITDNDIRTVQSVLLGIIAGK